MLRVCSLKCCNVLRVGECVVCAVCILECGNMMHVCILEHCNLSRVCNLACCNMLRVVMSSAVMGCVCGI